MDVFGSADRATWPQTLDRRLGTQNIAHHLLHAQAEPTLPGFGH